MARFASITLGQEDQQVMQAPTPETSTLRSIFQQWVTDGIGVIVAAMLGGVVILMAFIATVQSAKPWDTAIAALAMMSQAFFAYVVFRLTKQQYAFTKQTAERQHKIEMYPLRKQAVEIFEKASDLIRPFQPVTYFDTEAFRQCHVDISHLFSEDARKLSYDLNDELEESSALFTAALAVYDAETDKLTHGDSSAQDKAVLALDRAFDILGDLRNVLNAEMRIT